MPLDSKRPLAYNKKEIGYPSYKRTQTLHKHYTNTTHVLHMYYTCTTQTQMPTTKLYPMEFFEQQTPL